MINQTIKNAIKYFTPYGILRLFQIKNERRKKKREEERRRETINARNEHVRDNLFSIEVHIVEHCNLKCKGCYHFSNIADEEFLSLDAFEKDLQRLSKLVDKLSALKLLGGEPLLHPQICDFINISRNYFPNTPIIIVTNGIPLEKLDDKFWASCRDNNVTISISSYPINLNHKNIEKIAREQKVYLQYDGDRAKIYRKPTNKILMGKDHLDIQGSQDYVFSHSHCPHFQYCVTLRDGKIYMCCLAAHIKHFNKKFGTNLEITSKDCVDIHEINNVEAIYDYLCNPFPFCKYCVPEKRSYENWAVSKGDISEWT